MADADAIYSEINRTWKALGLLEVPMVETKNYRAALAAMAERGWFDPDAVQSYEPRADKWPHQLHIWSHCESPTRGHSQEHAELEREMQRVVLKALGLRARRGPRVFHQKFGYGTVTGHSVSHPGALEISFDRAGSKTVMASFVERAPLT